MIAPTRACDASARRANEAHGLARSSGDADATVQIGSERRGVVAAEIKGTRRAELWARFVAMYGGLETYQRQADRRFAVVALTPAE